MPPDSCAGLAFSKPSKPTRRMQILDHSGLGDTPATVEGQPMLR